MTENILARVKRLISGKIEDSVDAMERAGGTSVMREAIRETQRAIEDVKVERDEVTLRRLQSIRQQKLYRDRLDSLTEKADFALNEGREDLAKAALSRQVDHEAQILQLEKVELASSEQEREWEVALAQLELRLATMQEELKAYETAQSELGIDSDTDSHSKRKASQKIDRAEAAFNRAMAGAGGAAGISAVNVETASSLAELQTLQRERDIEARLDALRLKRAG
jgi:phage shock protein A